jgi:holo-[acyl-carrier protein] synthase
MKDKIDADLATLCVDKTHSAGNDLVFIPDFEKSLTPEFKAKVYSDNEIAYCELFDNSLQRYASTWAAKEAVYKALKQLDDSPLAWKKLEIIRDKAAGQPRVNLYQNPEKFKISLSISHDGDYAWAIAIVQLNQSPS